MAEGLFECANHGGEAGEHRREQGPGGAVHGDHHDFEPMENLSQFNSHSSVILKPGMKRVLRFLCSQNAFVAECVSVSPPDFPNSKRSRVPLRGAMSLAAERRIQCRDGIQRVCTRSSLLDSSLRC